MRLVYCSACSYLPNFLQPLHTVYWLLLILLTPKRYTKSKLSAPGNESGPPAHQSDHVSKRPTTIPTMPPRLFSKITFCNPRHKDCLSAHQFKTGWTGTNEYLNNTSCNMNHYKFAHLAGLNGNGQTLEGRKLLKTNQSFQLTLI